ncbi:hypothetical protein [Flavobacterium sp.]|jgi:hypothetical protein|uniref:hypothetical protein n=1 Tax=Flavobacterium sp. TaxID=239 RepID=UPI0037BF143C
MKDKIQTYVQFYLDEVELNISVKEDLTKHKEDEPLHKSGYIQITNGSSEDTIFWDGIPWALKVGKKEFKKECKKELRQKGYNWKETYKKVKTLLKRANKLDLL